MIPPYTGRCLCKAVTYRCDAEPLWQGHCHCESCRRTTGAGFASYFGVRNGAWSWTGELPTSHSSSTGAWRVFCPHCGTPLAFHGLRWPDEMHFHAGTLDFPKAFQPTAHFFSVERMPWIHLADGLPLK